MSSISRRLTPCGAAVCALLLAFGAAAQSNPHAAHVAQAA